MRRAGSTGSISQPQRSFDGSGSHSRWIDRHDNEQQRGKKASIPQSIANQTQASGDGFDHRQFCTCIHRERGRERCMSPPEHSSTLERSRSSPQQKPKPDAASYLISRACVGRSFANIFCNSRLPYRTLTLESAHRTALPRCSSPRGRGRRTPAIEERRRELSAPENDVILFLVGYIGCIPMVLRGYRSKASRAADGRHCKHRQRVL